jgi:hypothetical protein
MLSLDALANKQYITFKPEDHYVLKSSSPKEKYRRRTNETKTAIHSGQRKLFATVLQFMTLYVDLGTPDAEVFPKIVYAGAAPGHSISLLSKLFPTCEFHLYDTNPFSPLLEGNPKVTMYKQYFLDKDARQWASDPAVYFISDIRRDIVGKTSFEAEKIIQEDMQMQQKWVELMRPKQSHLKFHLPYSGLGFETTTEYLNGTVYVQPWRGASSTECRLVPKWGEKKNWNNVDYEDQNFYVNAVLREQTKFLNPIDGSTNPIDGQELINDYDSCLEISILLDYLKRFSPIYGEDYKRAVNLSRILTKTITFYIESLKSNVLMKHLRADPNLLNHKGSTFADEEE